MELRHTIVDGVPTVWAPSGGPLRAGLAFRVGRADETLARSGITHLIEHLALHDVDTATSHFNGVTSPRTTTFYISGRADEVVGFFATVCRSLRDLPTARLETEKALLRTEAARRGRNAIDQLLAWRHGPLTYGLTTFEEFGTYDLTADDVRSWARTWFTRDNAMLWICGGPPPSDLRLDLPNGMRMPLPVAGGVLPRLPAYFTGDIDGMAVDALVPRTAAAQLYAAVLGGRLHTRLRRELGVSYEARASCEPRDATNAAVTAIADALPERNAEVCREFVSILIDLARVAVHDDELDALRNRARYDDTDPAAVLGVLTGSADRLLTGLPILDAEERWARINAVTTADITNIGRQVLESALALVPRGQAIGRAGFVAAPTGSLDAVDGPAYRPVGNAENPRRLVCGDDGVSITNGLAVTTVRYAECAAMLAWPDGARTLFAPDAVTVAIEPQLWALPPDVMSAIDRQIPADRVVHMPARDAASIPRPRIPVAEPPAAPAPAAPTRSRHDRLQGILALLAIVVIVAGLAVVAIATGWTFAPVGIAIGTMSAIRVLVRKKPGQTGR